MRPFLPILQRQLRTALHVIVSIICLVFISAKTFSQTTVTIPATGTWTCPTGVTSISVECWGAGGAGGGSTINAAAGGGGGGGAYTKNTTVSVNPGTVYNITVGAGGVGGTGLGPTGGNTVATFGVTVVTANGGIGGAAGSALGAAGGSGGAAGTYSGGAGGPALNASFQGGGGGSSAGTSSNGNFTLNWQGAAAVTGGGAGANGANPGSSVNTDGTNATGIGGGGGGAYKKSGAGNSGGNGAPGQVKITYTQPVCPSSTTVAPGTAQSLCINIAATQLTASSVTGGTTGSPTIQYQWYYNTSNSNTIAGATLVAGATSSTFTPSTTVAELGTRYYFCVSYAANNGCGQTNATQSLASPAVQVTVTGITPGTYSVGPTGNYASIGAALSSISSCTIAGAYIFELQPAYVSSVETFPLTIPAITGASATNTITIRPAAAATNLTITGSNGTAIINMTAAKYVTFDGRAGGAGTTKNLTINNTNTLAPAIQFINDAQYNAFRYCNITSASVSSTTGAIEFASSATTGGNSNNTISNCDISGGASTVRIGIYSVGTNTAGRYNMNNTVSNCNIFNFFYNPGESYGIYMGAGTTDWTVSGNSFYETASRTSFSNFRWVAIYVDNNTNGNNFQFLNNYIGGTAANCGGTAMTIAEGAISAFKIKANPAAGTPVIIDGNTISNIAFSTASTSVNPMIYHVDGAITINNNTIGSQSLTNSITFTSPTAITPPSTQPTISGVMVGGALVSGSPEATVGGAVNVTNNTIGGFSVSATSVGASEFRGIDFGQVNCTFTITGNTIGSTSTANSVTNAAPNSIFGIVGFADKAGVTQTVSNNIVANLTCTHTGAADVQRVVGIQAQGTAAGGVYTVSNNTVYNLTSASSNVTRAAAAGIRAVNNAAASDGTIVANNTVYNISNNNNTVLANTALGIEYLGPAGSNNKVYNNKVYQVSLASTGNGGKIYGIYVSNGTALVYNNSVSLGYNNAGAALTESYNMYGIGEAGTATGNSYYFNTAAIGGTGVNGTANSFAFNSSITTAKTIKNNIFYNARANGSGTGKHYAYGLPASGSVSDYNDFAVSGTGTVLAQFGGTDYSSLSTWNSASSQDINSETEIPVFVSTTNLKLQAVEANGIINNMGLPIAGITADIDAETRNTLSPDPGFDEVKIDGSWIGPTSTNWQTNSNWETNIIPTSSISVWVRKASYYPLVSTTQPMKNLWMKGSTAAITLNGGALQIAGTITNIGGALSAINGTIELNGSGAAQNISASAFVSKTIKNFTISNPTGVNNSSAAGDTLKISGLLKFGSVNNSVFSTGNNLTLLSSAAATASVADITNAGANSGNSITGNATVERYISASRKWRFLSIPTNTTQTVKQAWQENDAQGASNVSNYGMHVTDIDAATWSANGFDFRSPSGPSVKYWNPASATFVGIANTSVSIKNTSGYMAYVRGDRNATPANSTLNSTVLRTTGSLYQNDQTPISVGVGQYVSIGNPYASAIDVRNLTKSNVQDFFYLWDPQLGGSYGLGAYQLLSRSGADYVVTPGGGSFGATGSITNFIQSGAAFMVRGTGTAGTVTFKENAKNPANSMVFRTAGEPEWMRVNMKVVTTDTVLMADGVLVNFDNNSSNGVDYDDALKSANTNENLSLKRDNKLLMLESRHSPVDGDTLFLNLSGVGVRNYRFDIMLHNMDVEGRNAIFIDSYLNTSKLLDLAGTTTINFNIENIPGSYAANRFKIVFKQMNVVPVTFTTISANRNADKSIAVKWNTENELNIANYEVEHSADGRTFTSFNSAAPTSNNGNAATYAKNDINPFSGDNFYRVKAIGRDGQVQYSAIAKVAALKTSTVMGVYPNPVVDKTMNVSFGDQPAGVYQLQLTNKLGQVIYQSSAKISGSNVTRSFQLNENVAAGYYQLSITSADGKANVLQVMVK